MKHFLPTCCLLLVMVLTLPSAGYSTTRGPELKFDFLSLYESNIFHSYEDSLETGSMVSYIDARAKWRFKSSWQFRHEIMGYAGIDYYPSYTQRNRSSFGVSWEPTYRYNRKGRFVGHFDLSHRNKDLIDDSGQTLTRTFEKTVIDLELTHRYDFGNIRLEQTVGYLNYNYDEFPGLTSYDYNSLTGSFCARWEFEEAWRLEATFSSGKRDYEERPTYTVSLRTSGPSEIRTFRENAAVLKLRREIADRHKVWASVEYIDRSENFENFYGYSFWQYRAGVSVEPTERLRMRLTARFKNKDYPNYWTGDIGLLNRVYIDYTDIKFKGLYALSDLVAITFYLRSYKKVSNDPDFTYTDITAGAGFSIDY